MPDRPTKKQYELLECIKRFVAEHGYGPSYREIMDRCNYNSVATVALHVNNLVKKGYLVKKGRSARCLEVVDSNQPEKSASPAGPDDKKQWLKDKIEAKFSQSKSDPNELETLIKALRILGLNTEADNFQARLEEIKPSNQ